MVSHPRAGRDASIRDLDRPAQPLQRPGGQCVHRHHTGVPVIAVGVPTVVDGATLAADLLGTEELPSLGEGSALLVTPKDIDSQVNDLAKVIGYGISMALQPGISLEELELLLS